MKLFTVIFLLTAVLSVQAQRTQWKRAEPADNELHLFHSPDVGRLPTAETMQKGDVEFEVSHRFSTPLTEGYNAFWGLDGPANIRLSLGYAVSNKLVVTLGRTNVMDNAELQVKYSAWQLKNDALQLLVSVRAGVAYNGEFFEPIKDNSRRYQYYGQLIANTMFGKKLGIGLVPTYLYNAYIFCVDPQYSFTLGSYAQYYVSQLVSVFVEANPTVSGWRQSYDSYTAGVELETGGHFFKVFLTNNDKVSTAQFVAGAALDAAKGDLCIGFMITRRF